MHFKMSSAICFNLDQSKILSSGNGFTDVIIVTPISYRITDNYMHTVYRKSLILYMSHELFTTQQNCRLVQIESICRQ